MIRARFVPLKLSDFPNPRHQSSRLLRCPFKSSYTRTLDMLEYELDKLAASDIEIHAGYRLDQLRNDGWPRGSATKPEHPVVILKFRDAEGRQLSFPCDRFAVFEVNLHAIGYTLKALRDVERYGVGKGNEQYGGYLQIAAPKAMTVDEAAAWLAERTELNSPNLIIKQESEYRAAYRAAASRVHPDHHGGDSEQWHRLQEVRRILDSHFRAWECR